MNNGRSALKTFYRPENPRIRYLRRWRQTLTAGTALVTLGGCMSLAPDYRQPTAPIPETYAAAVDSQGESAPTLSWNEYFTDPALQRLIETALSNNRDLRIAALRISEAQAAFRIQRSERLPAFDINAQGGRSRIPGDLSMTGESMVSSEYRAGVGLNSWELDFWGRVRNLETAALESWLATDAARRAVRVALIGQVAEGYLGLRELDERIGITQQSVVSREESYRIFQLRYKVGSASRLEVTQVKTLLTQAQMLLAQLEQQRAREINALRLLVGADMAPPNERIPFDDSIVLAPLAPGLPSALLTFRPDIVAAEHRLRATNANIGAARAAFFPRIALTSSYGTASADLDNLFESGSRAWSFMPVLSLPIFDGGRRRAGLELSEVRQELAVAEYEQTIQTAFREVADVLDSRHWITRQLEIARAARDAQAERAHLSQLSYDNGSVTYLEVLDAQRDLLDTEQQLIRTRRALLSNQIAMYRVLGGGAEPEPRLLTDSIPEARPLHEASQ